VSRAPVIVIDNVAAYSAERAHFNPGGYHRLGLVAPPFPQFWMEYLIPPDPAERERMTIGALCTELRRPEWALEMVMVSGGHADGAARCYCVQTLPLNEQGELADSTVSLHPMPMPGMTREFMSNFANQTMTPILLGIMFMHCKSVPRVEHAPPPKLVKRNLERGKPPMLRYQTLEIEGLKSILRSEGKIESVGLERALHLCRGHFAYYPPTGKGLFGRGQYGNFWIPSHARGTEKKGVIVSDYKVQPPEEEEPHE
jgi:hypothetical protein